MKVTYEARKNWSREGIVIEQTDTRARVLWSREFFTGVSEFNFQRERPLNVRTWVAKDKLTFK